MEPDSRSRARCLEVRLSSIERILVEVNTDSESRTITHLIQNNGGSLTLEPELLDHGSRDSLSLPTRKVKAGESERLLSQRDGVDRASRESPGGMAQDRTFVTMPRSALMSGEEETTTTNNSPSGTATMGLTKPGDLIRLASSIQDRLFQTVSHSK
jgi:hypothetical protein